MENEMCQLTLFDRDFLCGRTCPEPFPARAAKTSGRFSRKSAASSIAPVMCLDLSPGTGNLLGQSYWEMNSPWLGEYWTLGTGESPSAAVVSSLSRILEEAPPLKYYLSKTACLGILRRAEARGKALPPQLREALEIQAGVNLQRSPPISDEVRDLHGVAGAMGAQPGMKQQTFVADTGCLNAWDTQQSRIFTPEGVAPTLAWADGGGGRNPAGLLFAAGVVSKGDGDCFLTPETHTSLTGGGGQAGQGYPCVLTAGFCAGAAPTAGGIGYQEECSPTLKVADSGTNRVPSILCLSDQGGQRMDLSENISGTLRAGEHGHQPLVLASQQGGAEIGVGICPTITASAGMSGNNQPVLLERREPEETICIAGNAIGRQPQNGGNGLGCQSELAYSLTTADRHAVFSRQRVDVSKGDAAAISGGYEDNSQSVSEATCIVEPRLLIRRLTPLECERLQGYPDGWTDIPGASDSARYKALGNSMAIPCVDFVLRGIACFASEIEP